MYQDELEPSGISRQEFESVIRSINAEWAQQLRASSWQCMHSSGLLLKALGILFMLTAFLLGPMYLDDYGVLSIAGLPIGLLVVFIGVYTKGAGLQSLQQAKHFAVRQIQHKILDAVNNDPSRASSWVILDPAQAASYLPKLSKQSIKSGFRVVIKRRLGTSPRIEESVPTAIPAIAVRFDEQETPGFPHEHMQAPFATPIAEAASIVLPGSIPQESHILDDKSGYT